jgi:DNA-binding transcriptional ArsR family regulator
MKAVTSTWTALCDPHRRQMLGLLRARPRIVSELQAEVGLSQPGISKHLRILREAGLVQVEIDGPRRRYDVNPGPLAELDAWLEPFRTLWSDSLDALERHLDAVDPDGPRAAPHHPRTA